MFTKKDREIANLTAMVKNRDKLIGDLMDTNSIFRTIINSLEEDNKALREQSFNQIKNELSQTANQR